VCYCPFNPNVILPCVGEQNGRLRKAAGLAWWSGKVPGPPNESQFVCYCPFTPDVILLCVGEQGSTEEGGRAERVVRENSGTDKSSFVRYCPFNPNVMSVGEQGSTKDGGRADMVRRPTNLSSCVTVPLILTSRV
jgi:hypothetical protein